MIQQKEPEDEDEDKEEEEEEAEAEVDEVCPLSLTWQNNEFLIIRFLTPLLCFR